MDAILRRLPVKCSDGSIELIEIDGIFYLEAQGGRYAYPHQAEETLQIRTTAW